jgi:hypothetical protein
MVSTILTFALVANICLASAAPLSARLAGPKSFDKDEKIMLWFFVGMACFAVVWVGGFKTYDWVKAMYATKLEAKHQANQNADLEAAFSIELDNVKAPEPAKMNGSTSEVSSLKKKSEAQKLYVAGQTSARTSPNAGHSGALNHFPSMSTLREQQDPPPAYVKDSEFAIGSPSDLGLSDSEDE